MSNVYAVNKNVPVKEKVVESSNKGFIFRVEIDMYEIGSDGIILILDSMGYTQDRDYIIEREDISINMLYLLTRSKEEGKQIWNAARMWD